MIITDVQVKKLNETTESNIVGIASIVIDNCFIINGIRIISLDTGTFVAMPSKKVAENEYKDIVHPINAATKELIQDIILDSYYKLK